MKTIIDFDLHGKKVIIRVDFNVPFKDNKILDDNRIIMSLAVASLLCDEELTIDDESACSVTFPTFFTLFDKLKGEIK